MARIDAFKKHSTRYEAWFDKHYEAYISELLAIFEVKNITVMKIKSGLNMFTK